jgi:protein BCP1
LTYLSILCAQEADCQFEFCVKGDADSGVSGQWAEDDVEMSPFRRVLLLQANKLDPLIERIKTFVTEQQ